MRIRFFLLKNSFFRYISFGTGLKNGFLSRKNIFSYTNLLLMNKSNKFTFCCAIFLWCFSYWSTPLFGQDTLIVAPNKLDTLPIKAPKKPFLLKRFIKEDYPSPRKALTLAIIPGMGQIYNKKYWKLPLVYGALGGVIYAIDVNSSNYEAFRKALEFSVDPNQVESEHFEFCANRMDNLCDVPEVILRSRRDIFDKRRQLAWIGLIGFYLISAGDAFVDAHLKGFNVNDDISWTPSLQTSINNSAIVGISIKINLIK